MADKKTIGRLETPVGDILVVEGSEEELDLPSSAKQEIEMRAALIRWLNDARKPDPLFEEFRKRIGDKRGWATLMSNPLLKEFQSVRKGEKTLKQLVEWIEAEKKEGRLHLIHMRPESGSQEKIDERKI